MFAILKSVLHPRHAGGAKSQPAIDTPVRDALSRVRNESAREVPVFPARARHAQPAQQQPVAAPIQWLAVPSLDAVAHDASLHVDAANTGAVDWDWTPLPTEPSRRIDTSGIRVDGSEVTAALRAQLERRYGVVVSPLVIAGHEIGYRLQGTGLPSDTVMVSCHGCGVGAGVFSKPAEVEFRFASPRNTVLASATRCFAQLAMDRSRFDQDPSQVYGEDVRYAVDYELGGGISTTPAIAAQFLHEMREAGTPLPFDIALINEHAHGVRFSHLTQALQESPDGRPKTLICHFCRRQDDAAVVFNALQAR